MPSYIEQVSSLSPKIWYRFNETAGTPVNSGSLQSTTGNPGFVDLLLNEQSDVDGRAVYFNGSSSYGSLPSFPEFSLFNDRSFTVECWIKVLEADTNRSTPLEIFRLQSPTSPHKEISLVVGGNTANRGKLVQDSTWNAGAQMIAPTRVDDGKWHHVAVSVNTQYWFLYLDGIAQSAIIPGNLDASFNFDQSTRNMIGSGWTGISRTTRTNFFKGRIDEFAIYDRQLTDAELLANFNTGASVTFADTAGTASATSVTPTWSVETVLVASPMTASAASGDHYNSTVYFPTLLDLYMSTLTLQSWFKFDKYKTLTNYGTEPTRASVWAAGATNNPTGGVQGSGELKMDQTSQAIFQQTALTTGEVALLNDEDFTIGFWTKKLAKPTSNNAFIMSAAKSGVTDLLNFSYNTDGGITFNITHSGTDHTIASSTDITDGEWHFVVGKLSSNTMQLWVDGTSIGTTAMNHNLSLDFFQFDGSGSTDILSVSQFFIATASAIGTTEINNIWDYGTPSVLQGAAFMPEPVVRFNSAFNNYIESKNPVMDYRLDEGSGDPKNYGSAEISLTPFLSPKGYTQGEVSLNTKAFKFTSRDQTVRGSYSFAAGTFSTDDICTIGVLFKNANATNQQGIVGFGGRNTSGLDGNGFSLQMLATSGYLRIIAGNGNNTVSTYTGTTNYSDNKWHLATIVKSASTVKLYIDGKEHITASNSTAMTDNGEFIIAGVAGIQAGASSRDTLIDEVFVTNTAFTAQEAFEAWQSLRLEMDTNATASLPMPTNIAGTGTIQSVDEATSSALFMMPTFITDQILDAAPGTASGLFLLPNFGGNVVIDANYGSTAFEASALFHNPQANIGEVHFADHLDATALMVHPISTGGGTIAVPTATALDATFVMPGIVTIKGARVFANSMNSNAILPLPPAYLQLSDDDWYVRLYGAHFDGARESIQGTIGNLPNQPSTSVISGGFLTFFDDVTSDITPTTTVNTIESELGQFAFVEPDEYSFDDNGDLIPLDTTGNLSRATATRQSNTPQAILSTGLYDPYQRKAVRVNNIEFPFPGTSRNWSERPYNIEFSIKTTKSDQILTHGFWSSYLYNSRKIGVIGLYDGQIYLTEDSFTPSSFTFREGISGSITAPHPKNFINRAQYMLGRKNIADGNWHHVIIQQGWRSDNLRTQIWIDGQLDRQLITVGGGIPGFDGTNTIRPYILGFNSNDELLNSDFETSAWNFYPGRFLDTRNISLNYTAYQKSKPIKVKPMTATANATQDHLAQGNRSRALLLYWWPKESDGTIYYPSRISNQGYLSTFDSSVTTKDSKFTPPQDFQGWDIFPVSVVGDFKGNDSDIVKQSTLIVNDAYRNEITGARRYLDIVKDLDLTQIDAIFFANYPEDSEDLDSFIREEYADEYFQLKEVALYEDFLKSLRAAVDKGLSLFVTNERLALDLKIINKAETIPIFNELVNNDTDFSDFRAPILTGRTTFDEGLNKFIYNGPDDANDPVQPVSGGQSAAYWQDTFNNMRHRVVNTEMFLTDDASYIHTDQANYQHSDTIDFGGVNRHYNRFEYKMNGLQPGDEFIFGNFRDKTYLGNSRPRQTNSIRAIPFQDVNAGKIITAQPLNYWKKNTLTPNPYANYAHSIAINENDVLDGRPVGGKIFVCFSEVFWDRTDEYFQVDLNQDYWINIAFNNGLITEAQRDQLKGPSSLAYLGTDSPVESEYTRTKKYWSYNGDYNFSQQLSSDAYSGILGLLFDDDNRIERVSSTRKGLPSATRARDRLGRFASGSGVGSGGGLPFAQFITGHGSPTMNVYVPNLLTRAFWWLSDRIRPTGLVYRSEAMTANSAMPNGLARPDKAISINAEAMISNANIGNVFQSTLKSVSNLSLPMIATARIVELGKNILALPMIAVSSDLTHGVVTFGEDPIILKIHNIEPVLYIRGAKTT
jgi:hypothetical protein